MKRPIVSIDIYIITAGSSVFMLYVLYFKHNIYPISICSIIILFHSLIKSRHKKSRNHLVITCLCSMHIESNSNIFHLPSNTLRQMLLFINPTVRLLLRSTNVQNYIWGEFVPRIHMKNMVRKNRKTILLNNLLNYRHIKDEYISKNIYYGQQTCFLYFISLLVFYE